MNKPHDSQATTDIPLVPANSLDAGLTGAVDKPADPLDTTDPAYGAGSTVDSHPAAPPGAAVPANNLPAVPGYRVLREIARGGMGCVLAAYDLGLDRDVALKILLPGANADRFVRESKITARLPHPGIPPVHALGTLADGSPFLAMKLIAGQTLAEEMKSAERPRLLQAFTQVCQAVGFAHSRGVIHRDLKPQNVMVGAFGEVQVMDWGLAKDLAGRDGADEPPPTQTPAVATAGTDPNQTTDHRAAGESTDDQTQAGTVLGTPAYMAPEQARGEATDNRADVFALGGILCAILTGRPPYSGPSALEVIRRAAAADLAEAQTRLDGCGADVELVALCRRCLSPDPVDRPADGQAVADELNAYLNSVQERLQSAQRERAVALVREAEQHKRRRVQLALVAAVAVLLLGGGAFAWWQDRQTTERKLADEQAKGERERIEAEGKAKAARLDGELKAEARNKEQQARQGVEANLKLATDLRKQYRFKAAKDALDQAAVLAKGGAPDRLAEVEQAGRDLAFVIRLDDIRYRKWIWISEEGGKGRSNNAIASPEYRKAFAERGLDLTTLGPTEAAKQIAASAVKAELVAAVDDWALHEPEPGLRNRLLEIARRADPGPWTDRLRDPALRNNRAAVAKLAEDANPVNTSAATLNVLVELMRLRDLSPVPLLTAARIAHPTDFELAVLLGVHSKEGDDIGPYEAARALRPDTVGVWIDLGSALRRKGQVDGAIACHTKAIELDPKFAMAHYDLGVALSHKGLSDEAIASYRKAIELDPKYAMAYTNLGNVFSEKGQVDEAIASYRKAIELDPKSAPAHYGLGNALMDQGKMGQADEAIASYRKAIELDPKFAMAHSNLGVSLYLKGQLEGAIACYQKALAIDPMLVPALYSLGLALVNKGQLDEAIALWRKAIALDPKEAKAHCNLGHALATKGQFAESLASHKRGHELGSRQRGWNYPSAEWVRQAERKAALEAKLPAILKGEFQPRDNAERLDLAGVCQAKKFHHTATGLYAAAFAADPKQASNLQTRLRNSAACNAALAAAGQGEDATKLDDKAKVKLRGQALDWLKADLTAYTKLLDSGPPQARPFIVMTLSHWLKDSDFTGLRDAAALAKLPVDERKAFTQLWADVAALLKKAQEKVR